MSLWFFGWAGTCFVVRTPGRIRPALDRISSPEGSTIPRARRPLRGARAYADPSIPISYLYAFGENFATYTLDATLLVIAITFLGSAVAAALLPWR